MTSNWRALRELGARQTQVPDSRGPGGRVGESGRQRRR